MWGLNKPLSPPPHENTPEWYRDPAISPIFEPPLERERERDIGKSVRDDWSDKQILVFR